MKFQYSEKKVKLPENVHAYAEKKVMKLGRYFEGDAEALVVFSVEKNRNVVELTVRGAGTWFRACEATSDMFASIDAAVGTIEGQITPEQDEDDLSIVRVKQFYFRPMTREEAVLQMNLLGHNFFAFRDEDNGGCFAVVYRRENGGYGLLDDME